MPPGAPRCCTFVATDEHGIARAGLPVGDVWVRRATHGTSLPRRPAVPSDAVRLDWPARDPLRDAPLVVPVVGGARGA